MTIKKTPIKKGRHEECSHCQMGTRHYVARTLADGKKILAAKIPLCERCAEIKAAFLEKAESLCHLR